MPEVKEAVDKIQSIWEQMKAKNDEAVAEAKAISGKLETYRAEDRVAFDKFNEALDAQKEQLDDMVLKMERAKLPSIFADHAKEDTEQQRAYKSAFFKWVRQGPKEMLSDDWKALREAMPAERKALVENTAGLYLVPEDLESEIIRAIPQVNVLRNYCRIRTTSRDKVGINSLTEVSIGHGKLETGSDITESTMTPSRDSIYVEDVLGLTKVGEDELQDTDANLAAVIADSFSVAFANDEAKMLAVGRGHTTYQEQDGIAVDATLIASYKGNWTTADTVAMDDVLTCEYTLPTQYLNGAAWLMHRKTELAIRLYKEAVASGYYGNYMWAPGLAGQPDTFDSYPIIRQNDMNYPADATAGINVVFGNFKLGYMVVQRTGITLQRLDELYAEAGLVGFKAKVRLGGGPYRVEAFYGIYNNT